MCVGVYVESKSVYIYIYATPSSVRRGRHDVRMSSSRMVLTCKVFSKQRVSVSMVCDARRIISNWRRY